MKKLIAFALAFALMCSCGGVVDAVAEKVTCSYCSGSGKCPKCGGDGIVYLVVKCGECNGSGKCQRCNGRGYTANMDKPGAKDKLRQLEFCGILPQSREIESGQR